LDEIIRLNCRGVVGGIAEGPALVTNQPLSFFGEVDPNTGNIISERSEIKGKCVAGRVLVFPHGRGSTVGSYVIFALKENGVAPCAIVNEETEVIIAAGCSLANIPLVDRISGFSTSFVRDNDIVRVDGDNGWIEVKRRN
jgi:hypothetical protein